MSQIEASPSNLKTVEQRLAPTRPTRIRFRVLAAACSVAVVSYIHRVGFATASTEIKSDLCLSSEDLGYLMTAFLLAYGGFEVPGGCWEIDLASGIC
jgi:sugar phosphate permease